MAVAGLLPAALALSALAAGCGSSGTEGTSGTTTGTGAGPSPGGSTSATPGADAAAPTERTGGVVVRLPRAGTIAVVDEDHLALRIVDVGQQPPVAKEVTLPGRPAQAVAVGDAILVTIRDPGQLVRLVPAEGTWKIAGTAKLPDDAWGVAVSADRSHALVSSAWSRSVSAVDLAALAKAGESGATGEIEPLWKLAVSREPRSIVITEKGTAYVTHLVGADLTRIDGAMTPSPAASRVELPAAPLRAPSGRKIPASLGYAAALSPDGARLFAPRHALGALGREAWFGASTVDVLLTSGDTPLSPVHQGNGTVYRSALAKEVESPDTKANLPAEVVAPFTQPRDIRYRTSAGTVLVVGEGDGKLVELDASAIDPTLAVIATYALAKDRDPNLGVPGTCGAPAGLALSADEATAYVFCRSTYDLAVVPLVLASSVGRGAPKPTGDVVTTRLATDPLGDEVATGRRLFYDSVDPIASGGLACAGCHPEGRDDGFTWHEATFDTADGGTRANFVGSPEQVPDLAKTKGVPRQTPMLAARVEANGPYGWLGESKTLTDRIGASFGLHRWGGLPNHAPENVAARAGHLAPFLRKGLVPPALPSREPTEAEQRGKAIFESRETACATCHLPASAHTDRVSYPLRQLPTRATYDPDPKDSEWKTPSLRFVGGTEPYLHDGSASTLERLIEQNGDRMGKTNQLSPEQRTDLVAYLRTL
jgi:cytochrome c peroxidase